MAGARGAAAAAGVARWAPPVVALVWGANYTVNAWGLREFTVVGFNAARFLLAAPLLLAVARIAEGGLRVPRERWPRLLLSSAVGIVGYQLAFSAAVRLTAPATAAILVALSPFFAAVFGRWAGERSTVPAGRFLRGGLLAFAGVTLVVLGRGGGGAASWQGDALAVTAAALWGWYPVVTRPLLTGHSALRITAWTSTVGAAVLLPLAALTSFTVRGTAPDALSWFSLAYSVLLVTVAGLVLWYRAVRRAGSAAVMLWMFAVPPAAALFAAAVGADSLTWPQAAGTAVILAALGYVHAPARPSTRTHERALHDHHPRPGGHDRAGRARLRP